MTLDISAKQKGDITVIAAAGEMDYHNFRSLGNLVDQNLAAGAKKFLFDLRKLSYLDSSALGSLLYQQKRIREHQGDLAVVPSQALNDILSLTHLDSHFQTVESIASGREKLHSAALGNMGQVVPLKTGDR